MLDVDVDLVELELADVDVVVRVMTGARPSRCALPRLVALRA
jgi:hypothetical protein